jgi:hypothetical protein
MYLRGMPQRAIAKELGINTSTVTRNLRQVRKAWFERSIEAIGLRKADELAKLDQLELTYWDGWERSKKVKKVVTRQRVGLPQGLVDSDGTILNEHLDPEDAKKEMVFIRTEIMVGDPAFLDGVMKCIDKRCKILGLDAPNRNVNLDLNALSDLQLERLAAGEDIIEVLAIGGGVIDGQFPKDI